MGVRGDSPEGYYQSHKDSPAKHRAAAVYQAVDPGNQGRQRGRFVVTRRYGGPVGVPYEAFDGIPMYESILDSKPLAYLNKGKPLPRLERNLASGQRLRTGGLRPAVGLCTGQRHRCQGYSAR